MEPKASPTIDTQASAPAGAAPASAAEARALLRTVIRLRTLAAFASAVAVLALLGLFLTSQRFSPLRAIAVVGGQSITKRDYDEALEQKDGGKMLHDLVSDALVRQAADRAGVLPTEGDVAARLALIGQRDPGLAQAAEAEGSLSLLRDQIQAQMALENLRFHDVSVSDAEVRRYYEAHRANFQQRARASMTLVAADTAAGAEAAAADLHDGIPPDILAEQKGLHVAGQNGYQVNLGTPPGRALSESWKTMRVGQIRTGRLGKQFLVAQMVSVQPAQTIPLQDIKADVTRLARLDKAVSAEAELARLYQANPPAFPVDKYARYFDLGARAGGSPW